MSETRTYYCDVKDCHKPLSDGHGSCMTIRITRLPGWSSNSVWNGDLCEDHLTELTVWMATNGLRLEVDC